MAFRDLADIYAAKTEDEVAKEIQASERVEICGGDEAEI
jgi:hypothetical protein